MRVLMLAMVLAVSGCAGIGLNKQATLMPDEFSLSADMNPHGDNKITEVTGGLKWRLK